MPEYIAREALDAEIRRQIDECKPMSEGRFYGASFLATIECAPAADVAEVVRCKDCKHNGTWQCHMEYDEYHPEADIHHEMHGDDDFCSYGVKEDGAE